MKTKIMEKVLIALDYNPTAKKVAEMGYALGKSMGAEVTLLHVISDPVYYSTTEYSPITGFTGSTDMISFQMLVNGEDGLKKASQFFLDKTKDHLGDKSIKTLIMEGDFADIIFKTAKKLHIDVIVMGSHSQKWLENILMGSVTEDVLRHTNIPLFIVPTKK